MKSQVIALVGPPNSGKTTLFNWLTNRKYKTVNYPGATVEYALAQIAPQWGSDIKIMDTPGIYSLTPKSEDEEVTCHALFQHAEFGPIRHVIVVVDGTQLARHLALASQIIECGFKVTIALTMSDLIRKSGQKIDLQQLSQELACSVVLIDGLLGGGIQELVNKIKVGQKNQLTQVGQVNHTSQVNQPDLVRQTDEANQADRVSQADYHNLKEIKQIHWNKNDHFKLLEKMDSLAARVVTDLNSATKNVAISNTSVIAAEELINSGSAGDNTSKEQISHKASSLNSLNKKGHSQTPLILQRTRQVDRWILHPILGLSFFFIIMSSLFTAIFFVATPFMDAIDTLFSTLASSVAAMGNGGTSLWSDFVGNGIVTSFGAVFVFVPQIFILFFLLGYLEATGYLARAATLIDKPLSYFGLSGRSFVPILSGFACAIPAIMATRNISSKRDRFITMMIVPLMTCSARLPVYSLLLAFLFRGRPAWQAGVSLTLLYIGGLFVGALVSQFLHRILKKDRNSFFMMELPLYRQPRASVVLSYAWTKTWGYLQRAGPPIFVFALLVWVGTTFPNYNAENDQIKLETSYAGQLGHTIEPIFQPMGVDWRVGVSLISAFAAREVFASSLAVIFNVTGEDDSSLQAGLLDSMNSATDARGRTIFTTASVIALLIFVMVALQCTSTTAIVIRETGKVSWALAQVVAYNVLAYGLAVGTFNLLS